MSKARQINFEQAVYDAFGQVKDFTLAMRIARYFYEKAEKDLGWHSVDECLPEIDEEVIALTNQMNGKTLDTARCICYAHRPDPKGWDGRSLDTGEVKHYDVVTYDGWNIPGVKYWMPCPEIPNND